ncbi:hypothetical protein Tco_0894872 [Tanacetum coccineum]|uniref:Uncharacterized protein n=1 Tax=Tanacetum coccineum TaxID=301880 RepID=A0ABQ5CDB7_9ASTR
MQRNTTWGATSKGLQGQKEAKTVKNRQETKETRTRVKKQPKIKAGSARHSKKGNDKSRSDFRKPIQCQGRENHALSLEAPDLSCWAKQELLVFSMSLACDFQITLDLWLQVMEHESSNLFDPLNPKAYECRIFREQLADAGAGDVEVVLLM